MADADEILLEALLDDVLDERLLEEAVEEALHLLQGDGIADRVESFEVELAKVDRERARLVTAIAAGGELAGLVEGLREREGRRVRLEADREAVRAQRGLKACETGRVRDELHVLAASWRRVLADDPTHARPIVSALLTGRVTFTPLSKPKRWELRGEGTLAGLFAREMFPSDWRPQRDSNPCVRLECRSLWEPNE
jgi:hypothetical protein